jgi:hypothetical protein
MMVTRGRSIRRGLIAPVPVTAMVLVVLVLAAVAGCAADPDDAFVPTGVSATTVASAPAPAPTLPDVTVPTGVLAAVPFQNRLDVAQHLFQTKLYNGTHTDLDVVSVQFVWAGLTTPVSTRANPLVAGDRLDYPVPLVAATCLGDGTAATMPDPATAVVRVGLRDGRVLDVPVFDTLHMARTLYLQDCERQHIAAQVGLSWADLHAGELDGRPVTEGVLRLVRLAATGTVTVGFVSNTINFTFTGPTDRPPASPGAAAAAVAVLPVGVASFDVPIRFIEGRCDVHAQSESSQPFEFVLQLDLGDGVERSYDLLPAVADQVPMRHRYEQACAILGRTEFAGQADSTTVPAVRTVPTSTTAG